MISLGDNLILNTEEASKWQDDINQGNIIQVTGYEGFKNEHQKDISLNKIYKRCHHEKILTTHKPKYIMRHGLIYRLSINEDFIKHDSKVVLKQLVVLSKFRHLVI